MVRLLWPPACQHFVLYDADLADKGVANLGKCSMIVMDEADKLLSPEFQVREHPRPHLSAECYGDLRVCTGRCRSAIVQAVTTQRFCALIVAAGDGAACKPL